MEQTIIRLAIGLVLLVAVNVVLGSLNALFDFRPYQMPERRH